MMRLYLDEDVHEDVALAKEDILRGYPTLTKDGLDAALDFASRQFQGEEVKVYAGKK